MWPISRVLKANKTNRLEVGGGWGGGCVAARLEAGSKPVLQSTVIALTFLFVFLNHMIALLPFKLRPKQAVTDDLQSP